MGIRYIGIDPSTTTGFVALSPEGEILQGFEITTKEKKDPNRFMDIADQIIYKLRIDDSICIEGFSYGSKGKGISTQYGIGWLIRSYLIECGFKYQEVSPSGLKKFASGKGNAKKDNLVIPIYKKWGFESDSDNIRDAYILAQIARYKHEDIQRTSYQKEVIKNLEVI
jgi:crossover junction endodeoxyribonuclease RuvC